MGIKRTPTGRIYYDADEGADDPRQTRMAGLLGQLGERLKRSEEERDEIWKELQEYRKLIADIEDKTSNSEKVFLAVQNKLSRAEKIESDLTKRQNTLEEAQKAQYEKLAKAARKDPEILKRLDDGDALSAHLLEKLEASEAHQKRLDRRIEKMTQDRARLSRKLERLEESVLETQDALRTKALVLLTDRSVSDRTDLPRLPAAGGEDNDVIDGSAASGETGERHAVPQALWQRALNPQNISAASMVVIALLLGWTVSEWQRTRLPAAPAIYGTASQAPLRTAETEPQAQIPASRSPAGNIYGTPRTAAATDTMPESAEAADNAAPAPGSAAEILEDIPVEALESGDYDETALAAAMDLDPGAVAARLNDIAPGTAPQTAELPGREQAAEENEITQDAAFTQQDDVRGQPETTTPSGGEPETGLRSRMAPDRDLPEIVREIETQAYEGQATAQHDLAAIYTAGHGGVEQDYRRAAFWFRQAGQQGIANARYNLGVLYHQGLGVDQDLDKAIEWYRKAADLGHPEARYNLGIAHIEGIGVAYDPAKAADYFERSAEQGITEAAYNLGLIYENGLLGAPAPEQALLWYKLAADEGSAEARRAMEQLSQALGIDPAEIDRIAAETRPETARANTEPSSVDTTSGQLVRSVQGRLIELGLFPGPADGVAGQRTADAIRAYQARSGLPVNGEASEALLAHMLTDAETDGEVGSREE